MKVFMRVSLACVVLLFIGSCATGKDVVRVTEVKKGEKTGLSEKELASLAEIKAGKDSADNGHGLNDVINKTPNYSVKEYVALHREGNGPIARDYRVGGYDVLDIMVYEEDDLSRTGVRISADGYISFPMIGRIKAGGLTTSEIETKISNKLAQGQYIIDAHVSVTVQDYKSKQFMVLGQVKAPGSYPLKARERLIDGISRAGGIEVGGSSNSNDMMIIRTHDPDTENEKKIVIRIDLSSLIREGDQYSNVLLMDRDLLYIPKAKMFYLIGQVINPGSYYYTDKDITLVEAISKAGGFTKIAARNRTRIVRVEDGVDKIIVVKVDAITKGGQKAQDILIRPGDIVVVPEAYF
jgi:polysaccharide export outer membrane protein